MCVGGTTHLSHLKGDNKLLDRGAYKHAANGYKLMIVVLVVAARS